MKKSFKITLDIPDQAKTLFNPDCFQKYLKYCLDKTNWKFKTEEL